MLCKKIGSKEGVMVLGVSVVSMKPSIGEYNKY